MVVLEHPVGGDVAVDDHVVAAGHHRAAAAAAHAHAAGVAAAGAVQPVVELGGKCSFVP